MASVEPQVTTIWVSGSMSRPMRGLCLAARAARKLGAPHVMAYWCGPSWATSARRSVMAAGGSKSGKPCERLMASYFMETRVMRRITESVNCDVRVLSCCKRVFFLGRARDGARTALRGVLHKHNAYEARRFMRNIIDAALAPGRAPLGGGDPSRQDYDS